MSTRSKQSLLLLLGALGALGNASKADSDELSAMAHLETSIPQVGGHTSFTVRSPLRGALVMLYADTNRGVLNSGSFSLPVLCLSSTRIVVGAGSVDSSGLFQISLPTPVLGSTSFFQAVVVQGSEVYASACLGLTVGGATPATWSDQTTFLDTDTALHAAADVDWVDVNKDGFMDIVVANDGVGALPLILINDGSGNFTNEAALRLPAIALRPTSCVEVGDVNNDSWPDLFLGGGTGSSQPAENLILLNDRSGGFVEMRSIQNPIAGRHLSFASLPQGSQVFDHSGAGLAVDAEFGDVDGDGDLDLVVTNVQDPGFPSETPNTVSLYLNGGGVGGPLGRFVIQPAFALLPGNQAHGSHGDTSLADVDNDGDLDVFLCATTFQNRLYVNDGRGVFTDMTATALPVEIDNSFEAGFGDFDGDGDLDIFVANNVSASDPTAIHFYENQTQSPDNPVFVDSSFRIPVSFGPTTTIRLAMDVGDVDNDGDLDIFVAIHELPGAAGPDGETVLLLNQGGVQGGIQGTFAVDVSFLPGVFVGADVALGDADGDGDLDLYIASSGNLFQFDFHDELWFNNLQ